MKHPFISRHLRAPLLIALLACGVTAAADLEGPLAGPVVVRAYYEEISDIRALLDFDLWEFNNTEERYVLVAVDPAEYGQLEATGLRLRIDEELTARIREVHLPLPTQVSGIPGFPCYRTVEETFDTAAQIVTDHPDLATWIDFGDSWERSVGQGGFDMRVLRLTRSAVAGPKPKLVITSAIHAREYATAELSTRFAEYLTDNYGIDADATWLLDHHEIHLVLHTNPDGRKQAETGLLWRKNTNQNYCSPTSQNRGADLNRNFEFEWGCCGGSSGNECSEVYRGSTAASEPETQSVQSYLAAEFPDQRGDPIDEPAPLDATGVYIDIHSYGELMLWPWGFDFPPPNGPQLQTLGRKLAYFNGHEPKQAIELYPTDGTTLDFAYGELGVATYTYELGTWFFQDCSFFESVILPDNLPSLIYAAKVARTPYMTPAGPDARGVAAVPAHVEAGSPLTLSATIDDTRYNNSHGTEPVQPVAEAEYYLDTPPWDESGNPTAHPMSPVDGSFDGTIENVEAAVDTAGLNPGRHILFVRGKDVAGNWGAFSAAFFDIAQGADGTITGIVSDADSDLPLGGTVKVESLGLIASTDPQTGVYTLSVPEGAWDLRAASPGYVDQVAEDVSVDEGGVTVVDFALDRADVDGDGVADVEDCAVSNPDLWAAPSPAAGLAIDATEGNNLGWTPPSAPGAVAVVYDVLRSAGPADYSAATCVVTGAADTVASDAADPPVAGAYYYLVRARNGCGGSLGIDSSGEPRSGRLCAVQIAP